MDDRSRTRLIYIYLAFMFLWYAGAVITVALLGVTPLEALGIGVASGVFLGAFKDMWQFIFRKAKPE